MKRAQFDWPPKILAIILILSAFSASSDTDPSHVICDLLRKHKPVTVRITSATDDLAAIDVTDCEESIKEFIDRMELTTYTVRPRISLFRPPVRVSFINREGASGLVDILLYKSNTGYNAIPVDGPPDKTGCSSVIPTAIGYEVEPKAVFFHSIIDEVFRIEDIRFDNALKNAGTPVDTSRRSLH